MAFYANEPECWKLIIDFFTFRIPFRKIDPDLYCFPYFFDTVQHCETIKLGGYFKQIQRSSIPSIVF